MKRIDPTDPANLAKLPRWARWEIERLTRDLDSAYGRLNAGPEDSDTFADPYSDARRPLGRGVTVEFRTGDKLGDRIRVRTDRLHDGTVVLDVNGGERLAVLPRASNSIEIGLRP